jgi:hypothetical protein
MVSNATKILEKPENALLDKNFNIVFSTFYFYYSVGQRDIKSLKKWYYKGICKNVD